MLPDHISFANPNLLWSTLLVECWARLGLRLAVICPGSRSSPLAFAFAANPLVEAVPMLDERSAAFFALGRAKAAHQPVALVCTSGTAAANFLPAIIEAAESGAPLLVLTADRPPELRDNQSGQAIDQQKLYGAYPNWHYELAVPSSEPALLPTVRQAALHAWERALFPCPGPVHLNLPFRDPLVPFEDRFTPRLKEKFNADAFFGELEFEAPRFALQKQTDAAKLLAGWQKLEKGVIVVGPQSPRRPTVFCEAVARLAQLLGWPVLADALSPLRFYPELFPAGLVTTYEVLTRGRAATSELAPELVLCVGAFPTSKSLRTWVRETAAPVVVVGASERAVNPTLSAVRSVRIGVEEFAPGPGAAAAAARKPTNWLRQWQAADAAARKQIEQGLDAAKFLTEGAVARLLTASLPANTALFVGNSMPPRDLEYFGFGGASHLRPLCNRGASGIDGLVSTALGIAHRGGPTVALVGDLSFLHDSNGLLAARKLAGHLTLIVINNGGGGIFEMLPVARFDPPFEEFFATPQSVDLGKLCAAHGVEHLRVETLAALKPLVTELPARGLRVLEVVVPRKQGATFRRDLLASAAAAAEALFPKQ